MLKGIGITVIVSDIKKEGKINLIQDSLGNVLPKETIHQQTEKYHKFPNAYKLEYSLALTRKLTKEKIIFQMLSIADSIAKPWSIYFDQDGNNTELIFNKDKNTSIQHPDFSDIIWAHIQLIY